MFIAIDGIDGSGKTTLARQLRGFFEPSQPVFLTKEPTDLSKWGQRLRRAAVEGRLSAEVELEYFKKDREYHLEHHVRPALASGKVVISDRYVDSTLAFQTNDPSGAESLYQSMVGEVLVPDVTFIIDCPVEIGLSRVEARDKGKLSQFEKRDTLEKAASIYLSRSGKNYVHLDGSKSPKETLIQAINSLSTRLDESHPLYGVLATDDQAQSSESFARAYAAG